MMDDMGTVREVANGFELRFERHFEQPIDEVWEAITEPEQLSEWIGSGDVDLKPGGRIRLDEHGGAAIDGEVLEVAAPNLFSFKWDSPEWGDGGPVRFELSEDEDGGTLLVFTHVHPAPAFDQFRTQTLASWHYLTGRLEASLAGHPRAFEMASWQEIFQRYLAATAVYA